MLWRKCLLITVFSIFVFNKIKHERMLEFPREKLSWARKIIFLLNFSLKALLTFLHYFGFREHCSIETETEFCYNLTLASCKKLPLLQLQRRLQLQIRGSGSSCKVLIVWDFLASDRRIPWLLTPESLTNPWWQTIPWQLPLYGGRAGRGEGRGERRVKYMIPDPSSEKRASVGWG